MNPQPPISARITTAFPGSGAVKPAPNKTILGIALPGIAPLRPGENAAAPALEELAAPAPISGVSAVSTSGAAVVAPPAPLIDEPAPRPVRIVRPRGVPVVAVPLLAGSLLLSGGLAIALLWRGQPPIVAQPQVSSTGEDILHLRCDPRSCADGTTVEVGGARATFVGGETDVALSQPLRIGDNPLSLRVDRPGLGRDETVKLIVPVTFRVQADLGAMNDPHPSVAIHVEAHPGSEAVVDGHSITLDDAGRGTYAIDEREATEGPADESRVLSLDVPYSITPKGLVTQQGTVSARVAVAPLRVDSPHSGVVVDRDHIVVSGRAAKGADVTVDGAPAPVAADGAFEASVALGALGDRTVDVIAKTAWLRPRTVHVSVKRVASLADEARAFERHEKTVGYDVAAHSLPSSVGRAIIVDGEVIDSRSSGVRTVLLVDDRRGCAKGPCVARVVLDGYFSFPRGAFVRACGHVARPFATPGGQSVPEVEAQFVVATTKR